MLSVIAAASMAIQFAPGTVEADVVAATREWLDAFEANDAQWQARLTHPDGVSYTIRSRPGQDRIGVRTNRQDLAEAGKPAPAYREIFWDPQVLVRGDLAQFWAPYSFDIDGKRSHCGIDNFTLIRVDGQWIVANTSWTVEPVETCAALGEPK